MHLLGLHAPTPAQLRRIAELTESLFDADAARPWWKRAAKAGDEDAADYLDVLTEEEKWKGEEG